MGSGSQHPQTRRSLFHCSTQHWSCTPNGSVGHGEPSEMMQRIIRLPMTWTLKPYDALLSILLLISISKYLPNANADGDDSSEDLTTESSEDFATGDAIVHYTLPWWHPEIQWVADNRVSTPCTAFFFTPHLLTKTSFHLGCIHRKSPFSRQRSRFSTFHPSKYRREASFL